MEEGLPSVYVYTCFILFTLWRNPNAVREKKRKHRQEPLHSKLPGEKTKIPKSSDTKTKVHVWVWSQVGHAQFWEAVQVLAPVVGAAVLPAAPTEAVGVVLPDPSKLSHESTVCRIL